MTVSHPWGKRPQRRSSGSGGSGEPPYLKARFTDEYGRYAEIDGVEFPVLLSSCLAGVEYKEDVEELEEGAPEDWYEKFVGALILGAMAIVVKDQSADDWPFSGLYRVSAARLTNFVSCTLGERLARLHPY